MYIRYNECYGRKKSRLCESMSVWRLNSQLTPFDQESTINMPFDKRLQDLAISRRAPQEV